MDKYIHSCLQLHISGKHRIRYFFFLSVKRLDKNCLIFEVDKDKVIHLGWGGLFLWVGKISGFARSENEWMSDSWGEGV